jgi:hypothetical protein
MKRPNIKNQAWIAGGLAHHWLLDCQEQIESGQEPKKLSTLFSEGWQVDKNWPEATKNRITAIALKSAKRELCRGKWPMVREYFSVAATAP